MKPIKETLDQLQAVGSEIAELHKEVIRHSLEKNRAYAERNALVCLLSKIFPAWLSKDYNEPEEWQNVVFIKLANRQASWHIHESDLYPAFDHLRGISPLEAYDGHTTDQKYDHILSIHQDDLKYNLVEALGCAL